ncbi:hypothetical protein [uncultured Varibaculum sp.]|uniref:hypothetical protein n=1 Tax=uncultured Varibaculum sp. TaxID=413896 RepID=UPI0025847D4F|nr:hypothetical protein [uncultured Varibaculum sp.]
MATESLSLGRDYWVTANARFNPMVRARKVKHLRSCGYWLGCQFRNKHGLKKVPRLRMEVTVTNPPRGGCRDVANYHPTVKAILDGIVDAGVLEDDDNRHLEGPFLRPGVGRSKHRGVASFEIALIPLPA